MAILSLTAGRHLNGEKISGINASILFQRFFWYNVWVMGWHVSAQVEDHTSDGNERIVAILAVMGG